MVRRVKSLRFLRYVGVLLAAAFTLPAVYASDGTNAQNAKVAIASAKRAVAAAIAQNALWTSAEDALRRAERAMEGGDAAAALEHARFATGQAQLGLAQKQYPQTR